MQRVSSSKQSSLFSVFSSSYSETFDVVRPKRANSPARCGVKINIITTMHLDAPIHPTKRPSKIYDRVHSASKRLAAENVSRRRRASRSSSSSSSSTRSLSRCSDADSTSSSSSYPKETSPAALVALSTGPVVSCIESLLDQKMYRPRSETPSRSLASSHPLASVLYTGVYGSDEEDDEEEYGFFVCIDSSSLDHRTGCHCQPSPFG